MEYIASFFNVQQYYGLDYLIATCVVCAMFLLGNKNKFGFVVYFMASTMGIAFSILVKSPPILLTNLIMIVVNVRGFARWKQG